MKILMLLGLLLITFGFTKAQEIDTVLIRQFSYSDYSAGITNYSGTIGKDGLVFFGNSQGVLIYDGSDWELVNIVDGKPVLVVLYVEDTLYIGSNDEIGYMVLNANDKWQYSSLNHLLSDNLQIDDIWQIVKTDAGIYFESYNTILLYDGKSITEIDIKDSFIFKVGDYLVSSSFSNELRLIKRDSIMATFNSSALFNDAAFSILPSLNNSEHILFTSEHGAYKLTLDPFKIVPWNSPISNLLKEDGFYHGVEYHDSLIVCTTWDQGVILFNKNGEVIKQIDIESGLPNRALLELFVDDNDNIWIPSRSGIYQLRLTLDKIAENFRPITSIKSVSSEHGIISDLNNIFDPNYIVFDYTTPGFNKSDIEYAFFLEGYDDDWTPWSKQYKKEYTNLGNGNYTFRVKARIIGTDIESVEGKLMFHLVLPWYKRPIFYFVIGVVIIVLILLVMRIRTMRLNKSKRALAEIVNARTKELLEEREKLKSLNKELQTANIELDNFVYRSSHDLIAPLKSLRGLMAVTRLETNDSQMLQYISLMETSVFKLEKFINSIMEYSINAKSETENKKIDLNHLLDDIFGEIQYFDKFSDIKFRRQIDDSEFVSDPKRLKIVLNNLITNAIKYHDIEQEHPWIKIKAGRNNGMFEIEVEDNGLGIGPEHLDKIFDMFYRASENAEGSGLGLYIVKDTMKKLNGQVKINSTINQGSSFILKFPVA
jgi:signal transduction histidine kinase